MVSYKYLYNILPQLLFSILLFSVIILIFITKPWGDEIAYHYPNAKYFSLERIIMEDSQYSSAYTPLPYLFSKIILQVHDSILSLRIFNFIIFIILCLFIYLISKKISNSPFLLTLIIISNPYLLRSAYAYYMFNYGLTFSIIGIYLYFFSTLRYRYFFSHIFLGLAVLSQQWMLIIIVSIFIFELFIENNYGVPLIRFIKIFVVKLIILLPSIYLFILWGGLTHPNFHFHKLYPTFEHLNAVLANWGYLTFFIVLFYFRDYLYKKYLIPLVFVFPILFFSIPSHSSDQGVHQITGLVSQLSSTLSKIISIPYQFIFFIFVMFGLGFLVISIIKEKREFETFIFYVLVLLLIVFTASIRLGASHILLSAPFIFLLFNKEIFKYRYLKYLILFQLYFTSIFYIYYYALFVVKGRSF